MSSTVERIEKSKTSDCLELVSKTRSNVNAPLASLDYGLVRSTLCICEPRFCLTALDQNHSKHQAHIDGACFFCLEVHYAISSACQLRFVWGSKSRNDYLISVGSLNKMHAASGSRTLDSIAGTFRSHDCQSMRLHNLYELYLRHVDEVGPDSLMRKTKETNVRKTLIRGPLDCY